MTAPDAAVEALDALRVRLASRTLGTWRWDRATGVVEWDQTLEGMCGLAPGTFGGTFEAWVQTLHPDEVEGILATVDAALARCEPYDLEHRTVWPDGSIRWLECRGEVVVDDRGEAVGTVGCALDVTERKHSEQALAALVDEVQASADRLRRLQRVSHRVASALNPDDVVDAAMDTLDAPRTATARAVWLVSGDGDALELVRHRGMRPEVTDLFGRIPLDSTLPGAIAVRERRTIVSPSQSDAVERFPVIAGVPRSAEGFIAVPLLVDGGALGVLAFGYDGALDDDDVVFLEAAAGHLAQTLQRVRFGAALHQRADEIAFLAHVMRSAVTATDRRSLMRAVTSAMVPRLGTLCSLHHVPEPGAEVEAVVVHADPKRAAWAEDLAARFPYDPTGEQGVAAVLRHGRPEVVDDIGRVVADGAADRFAAVGDARRTVAELGLTTAITVPIHSGGRVIGALQALGTATTPGELQDRLVLADAVVSGIGDALQNRWLSDQQRHIATTLQRAFLPPALPSVPGMDIAAAYWPAGSANVVGGDFYDVFAVDERRWAIVIGDACGTGPDAAATAAIARHTARAAARHGGDHLDVLHWVNQAVRLSDRDLFCTACYATVEVADDGTVHLAVAVAGHPLPVHLTTDGARYLGQHGTLLGVFDDATWTVSEATVVPGEAVAFYTDGVTDLPPPYLRTETELLDLLDEVPAGTDAAGVVAHIRADLDRRVPAHRLADDIAVLVVHAGQRRPA